MIALLDALMGLGRARFILKFSLCLVALNLFFSFVLIFGELGFPALGIAGAGWGLALSYWIAGFILSLYLIVHKSYSIYLRHLFFFTRKTHLYELLRLGLPVGFVYSIEVIFFFTLMLIMGSLGDQILAANQIALQYMTTLMTIIFSFGQAITVRMSQLLGAGTLVDAKRAGYTGIYISFSFMFMVSLLYWFFPNTLIAVDINIHAPENQVIVTYATRILAISALFQMLESLRISLFGALRSLKDTQFTLLISILGFWVIALPLGYTLKAYTKLGGLGLWWGMTLGAAISALLLFRRFSYLIHHYKSGNSVIPEQRLS